MQERKLNLHRIDDNSLVELSEEVIEKLEKLGSDFFGVVSYMTDLVKNKTLTVEKSSTISHLLEYYTVDVHKLLNYESLIRTKIEERNAEIRTVNLENRELRKLLGERVSNDDVREMMKNTKTKINKWWDDFGCGYVPDIFLKEYCMEVHLSLMISGIGKKTGEVHKLLEAQGVLLDGDEVIDCDINRDWLKNLVTSTFPSATMWKIESGNHRGNKMTLRDASFFIRDLNDLDLL